jgi:glycosyltransferase involved in cell wall biosynthesis
MSATSVCVKRPVLDRAAPRASAVRVALLYTPLSELGGGERQVLEEQRWLRRRGVAATVLTFQLEASQFSGFRLGRDEVCVLPGVGCRQRVSALRRALRDGGFDVLIAHSSAELAWLATRDVETALVVCASDPPWYRYACDPVPPRRYARRFAGRVERFPNRPRPHGARLPLAHLGAEARHALTRRALCAADAVIVLSEQNAAQQRELHGVESTVVRGCVERAMGAAQPSGEREPIVLSVSRLVPVKLVDRLLRAFANVRAAEPSARLLVVGAGPEAASLRALAATLGLDEHVEFVGHAAEHELSAIYRTSAVFAAPTQADYNIAPYEALAHGCKVVWAHQMQTEPALEREGWVHPSASDAVSLAAAIVRALRTTPRTRPDLAHMTWAARAARVEAVCRSTIERGA